jgi:DNA-binding FrmR family transcriptional regulator
MQTEQTEQPEQAEQTGEPTAGEVGIPLDPSEMGKVINRLKRAQGQLSGVLKMLEAGRNCEDIVTQLSAVSRALDRAGFAIIATGMRQCLVETDGAETVNVQKLEKLFLSLA